MPNIVKLVGEIDAWGYMTYSIQHQLAEFDGQDVELQIDSLGGSVTEAKTIQNAIKSHNGEVTAHIVGFSASAATWVATACKKVVMNSDCLLLVHQASNVIDILQYANADDLEKIISDLEKNKKDNEAFDLTIANMYVKHSAGKLTVESALKLMKEAKWLTPEECLNNGLIDSIDEESKMQLVNMAETMKLINSGALPKLPKKFRSEQKKNSLADTLKEVLTNFFGGAVANVNGIQALQIQNNQIVKMNKSFVKVNALLNVEGIEEAEGKVSLSVENITTLENALKANEEKLNEKVNAITALEGEKANLQKELDDAKALINKLNSQPEQPKTQGEEQGKVNEKFADIAHDEVDKYFK